MSSAAAWFGKGLFSLDIYYSRGLGSLIDSDAPFIDRCSQT